MTQICLFPSDVHRYGVDSILFNWEQCISVHRILQNRDANIACTQWEDLVGSKSGTFAKWAGPTFGGFHVQDLYSNVYYYM